MIYWVKIYEVNEDGEVDKNKFIYRYFNDFKLFQNLCYQLEKVKELEWSCNTNYKVESQKCYFDRYKIDENYYWYYDENKQYHIEDKRTGKVVFVTEANSSKEAINKWINKIEGNKNERK